MDGELFTLDDIDSCWPDWHKQYLIDILNGEYKLFHARDDLKSLIGSEYDNRVKQNNLT